MLQAEDALKISERFHQHGRTSNEDTEYLVTMIVMMIVRLIGLTLSFRQRRTLR